MKQLSLFALLAFSAFAQQVKPTCNTATIPVCSAPVLAGVNYTKAGAIPTSTTTVTSNDAYISQITLSGGASAVTVTLTDGNGTIFVNAMSLSANQVYIMPFPEGYWAQGGFTIVASGTGSTFQINFKQ